MVMYCDKCGKHFSSWEEKEEHEKKIHGGQQSKLF